ncbi:hypothetical protein DI43_15765 [Geobacillus sp. CAMR12739]|nr:hypothetical protein DI43_15765 [Geobacillus sp. CAMR12739]
MLASRNVINVVRFSSFENHGFGRDGWFFAPSSLSAILWDRERAQANQENRKKRQLKQIPSPSRRHHRSIREAAASPH